MPAQGTKKYIVVAHPFSANQKKGINLWKESKPGTETKEPTGEQMYYEAGSEVFLTPEAAAPLVEIGRLRPAEA